MKISRRAVLAGATGFGLFATTGIVVFPNRHGTEQLIRKVIEEDLSYLKISEAVKSAFLKDFIENEKFPTIISFRNIASLEFMAAEKLNIYEFEKLRRKVATKFLLSTDFFTNGANVDNKISYVNYQDPYLAPCYNPLRGINA